jgi:hypothetical protein
MKELKNIFSSKLTEYILTGAIPITSFVASRLLTKLNGEFSFSEWYKLNVIFFWLFVLIIIMTSWLITNKCLSSMKESFLSRKYDELSKFKNQLINENHLLKLEISSLSNETLMLKESFDFISKDYYNRIGELLKTIFLDSQLSLTVDDRISIYRHIDDMNMFFMLGRYSKNSEYRKCGRMLYPDNIGFIGKAWNQDDDLCEKNLPDYSVEPENYLKVVHDKSGIDIEILKKLAMKGRFLFITKLVRKDQVTPDMVVVFESIKPNRLNKAKLQRILSVHLPELQIQVNLQTPYEPSEEYAELLGFGNSKM